MSAKKAIRESKGFRIIIFLQFAVNLSVFASFPLLVLYFQRQGALTSTQIATIATINLISSRLLPVFIGAMVDRLSVSVSASIAFILRSLSFFAFSHFSEFWPLVLVSMLNGIGAAMYETMAYGVIGNAPEERKPGLFYLNSMALNTGALLGPAAFLFFKPEGLQLAFDVSGIVFLLLTPLSLRLKKDELLRSSSAYWQALRDVFCDKEFQRLMFILVPFWMLYVQIYNFLPLQLDAYGASDGSLRLFYIFNGILGVALSIAIASFLPRFGWFKILKFGHLIFAVTFIVGAVAVYFSGKQSLSSIVLVLVFVVPFTTAETMILPTSDMAITRLATPGQQATYFGASSTSWAVGGSLGTYAGVYFGRAESGLWGWLFFFIVALLGYFAFVRHTPPTARS